MKQEITFLYGIFYEIAKFGLSRIFHKAKQGTKKHLLYLVIYVMKQENILKNRKQKLGLYMTACWSIEVKDISHGTSMVNPPYSPDLTLVISIWFLFEINSERKRCKNIKCKKIIKMTKQLKVFQVG